ncbi:MAG: transcription termination factor Rho [Opitutales bacterium]|nr:transcription termination factor Rho [Opitutales bacterium]
MPSPPKSVFSFDPEEEKPASEPALKAESVSEQAASIPVSAEPESASASDVPAPAARPAESAKPWEKKDRPWKKPWERNGSAPQQGGENGGSNGNASAPNPGQGGVPAKPWEKKPFAPKAPKFGGGKFNPQGKFEKFRPNDNKPAQKRSWGELANADSAEEASLSLGAVFDYNLLGNEAYLEELAKLARHVAKRVDKASPFVAPELVPAAEGEAPSVPAKAELEEDLPAAPIDFNEVYESSMSLLISAAKSFGIPVFRNPVRRPLVKKILRAAFAESRPIKICGTLELLADGNGLLLYGCDSYRVKELSAFVPKSLIEKYGLQRGHDVEAVAFPPMKGETAPIVVHISSIMGAEPESVKDLTPFTELTPYYPTERIMLETDNTVEWNNLSMRCVDLLCPIGLGQRGLIVAPPRTGKTVLLQAIANSIAKNKPNAHLIVLLVDERPEEVTDFKRKTKHGEVISSTFDENAENHVHVAEMVIERARRMVELGKDVIILLDSITRLARAYNTLMPNGGKILSGGVEAGALSKPKRFFGSARNIEDGGSLTILGTALIDTGSKMDEVIFEEFKGTGNMELDLDRDLANKRIYPAINFERSGTRKEELLYHPQEMQCVYSMRRAMKGVPSIEAMEMLISRMKKTKTNAEFLMTLAGR